MRGLPTFLALQAGWFACVLGAASGRPLVGVVVVALTSAAHLLRSDDRRGLTCTLGAAAVVGLVSDGSLALGGILVFPPQAALGWPVPIWMLALWVNFALAIDSLLTVSEPREGGRGRGAPDRAAGATLVTTALGAEHASPRRGPVPQVLKPTAVAFVQRPVVAALAGAAGGPLSYLAGARLGAVTLLPSEPIALAVVGLVWSLAMPLLVCVLPRVRAVVGRPPGSPLEATAPVAATDGGAAR